MKKIVVSLGLLSISFFIGCDKGNVLSDMDKLLIGNWAELPSEERFFLTFDTNTAVWWMVLNDDGVKRNESHYTYTFDNETMTLSFSTLQGETLHAKVLVLDQNILSYKGEMENTALTYYRQN
jgi:hypothetical protein